MSSKGVINDKKHSGEYKPNKEVNAEVPIRYKRSIFLSSYSPIQSETMDTL